MKIGMALTRSILGVIPKIQNENTCIVLLIENCYRLNEYTALADTDGSLIPELESRDK